jgi:GDP-L-fucose synthase
MKERKILLAGARGMVGSSIARHLEKYQLEELLTPGRGEVDFTQQDQVKEYLQQHRPDLLIVVAAKVGGILANERYPAEFLYENLMIASNAIHQAHEADVGRLLFLGSTCIYPKYAPQPILEECLLSGPLEKTNEAYALAKIAGVKLCEYYRKQYGRKYISAMPTNLYGPGDNYHPENSHVLPALLRRFHEAKEQGAEEVMLWGSGKPLREFLHVDDLAKACLFLLENYDSSSTINIGSHDEVTIRGLAEMIADVVGFQGSIVHDLSKPDGTPRKKTDCTRLLSMGWSPEISLEKGIERTYQDFLLTL